MSCLCEAIIRENNDGTAFLHGKLGCIIAENNYGRFLTASLTRVLDLLRRYDYNLCGFACSPSMGSDEDSEQVGTPTSSSVSSWSETQTFHRQCSGYPARKRCSEIHGNGKEIQQYVRCGVVFVEFGLMYVT